MEKAVEQGRTTRRASIHSTNHESFTSKKPWWHDIKELGSAPQIVLAAALAIAIGMAVTSTVDDIPDAASTILAIPGTLWLRSLRAVGQCSKHCHHRHSYEPSPNNLQSYR